MEWFRLPKPNQTDPARTVNTIKNPVEYLYKMEKGF